MSVILDIENLVNSAKSGDKDSFVLLVKTHEKTMYFVAKTYLRDDHDCADAISEAILNAYKSLKRLKDPTAFKSWLMKILVNEAKKISLKKGSVLVSETTEVSAIQDDYNTIEIMQLVKMLDSDLSAVLILFYFEDFKVSEISSILNIPEGTVKSRLSTARKKLSDILRR